MGRCRDPEWSTRFRWKIVAVQFFVLINPELIPIPLLLQGVFFTGAVMWRERRAIDIPALKWAAIDLLPGIALGTMTLTSVNKDTLDSPGQFVSFNCDQPSSNWCPRATGSVKVDPWSGHWWLYGHPLPQYL